LLADNIEEADTAHVKLKSSSKFVTLNIYNMTCIEVLAVWFTPRPHSFTFLLLLWLPFLFDSPPLSSCPFVSTFLSSFTQCPGGCPSTCILSSFLRLFSIHCSEVTLASLPAFLFFFRASRWQRRAMAPDPVVTSFPSWASSHFSDVAVMYLLPLLYFHMIHSDWLAYSP
jgi:hypothetical protein